MPPWSQGRGQQHSTAASRQHAPERHWLAHHFPPATTPRSDTLKRCKQARNYAVAIYSCNALRSFSISAIRYLTISPIETSPSSLPLCTTGTWRKRPCVIISIVE